MLPSPTVHRALQKTDGFRWRSHEASRIEWLGDAVFAFAITFLVVFLEVPRTFSELNELMRGGLCCCFSYFFTSIP